MYIRYQAVYYVFCFNCALFLQNMLLVYNPLKFVCQTTTARSTRPAHETHTRRDAAATHAKGPKRICRSCVCVSRSLARQSRKINFGLFVGRTLTLLDCLKSIMRASLHIPILKFDRVYCKQVCKQYIHTMYGICMYVCGRLVKKFTRRERKTT